MARLVVLAAIVAMATCKSLFTLSDEDVNSISKTVMKSVIQSTYGEEFTCEKCETLQTEVKDVLSALFLGGYIPIANFLCKIVAEKGVVTEEGCHLLVKHYIPAFEKSFFKLFVQHDGFICSFIFEKCEPTTITRFDLQPILDDIYKDMPPKKEVKPTGRATYTILQVNDIHIDLNYSVGSIVNCDNGVICCRNISTSNATEKIYAGYWGTNQGSCDIPRQLFEAFVEQAKELKPDYIFWLGDNENHEVDSVTKEVNIITTKVIADKLAELTDHSKIFLSIGNHENSPVDMMDFDDKKGNQWFFQNLTGDYKPLLTQDEEAQI